MRSADKTPSPLRFSGHDADPSAWFFAGLLAVAAVLAIHGLVQSFAIPAVDAALVARAGGSAFTALTGMAGL